LRQGIGVPPIAELLEKRTHKVANRDKYKGERTGFGIINDEEGRPLFAIFVKKKRKTHKHFEKLKLDGIPLVVRELPAMHAMGIDRTVKRRPAEGGISVGHVDISAGTIGCVVRKIGSSKKYLLSNQHVFGNSNDANIGDDIIQPGDFDGGASPADKIGELFEYEELLWCPACLSSPGSCDVNYVDAALCEPTFQGDVVEELLELSKAPIQYTTDPYAGLKIAKSGRTTAITRGRILISSWWGCVGYDAKLAYFEDQIVTTPYFCWGGDSGSLVIIDPYRDILTCEPEVGVRDIVTCEPEVGDRDISTDCSFPIQGGPLICWACEREHIAEETPQYLNVTISGISVCPIHCLVQPPTESAKVLTFAVQAMKAKPVINGAVGLLFAGSGLGHAVLSPMGRVVDAFGLDLVGAPQILTPIDLVVPRTSGGPYPDNCTWGYAFGGNFGTIRHYLNENDCTGDSEILILDTLEILIITNENKENPTRLKGIVEIWVRNSTLPDAFQYVRCFSNWNDPSIGDGVECHCGMIGTWNNQLECNDGEEVFTGGSVTIREAAWPDFNAPPPSP